MSNTYTKDEKLIHLILTKRSTEEVLNAVAQLPSTERKSLLGILLKSARYPSPKPRGETN